jgi:hypothetical protein
MSSKSKLTPPSRSPKVLLPSSAAEVEPGSHYQTTVKHDPWCPGLKSQSMLLSQCSLVGREGTGWRARYFSAEINI